MAVDLEEEVAVEVPVDSEVLVAEVLVEAVAAEVGKKIISIKNPGIQWLGFFVCFK